MIIAALTQDRIPDIEALMTLGEPYVRVRGSSDYWLYAGLFSSTCRVALADNEMIGAVIAFRSQDTPADIYIQDVMVHPEHRRRGITRALLHAVRQQGTAWGCSRMYLTSEPDNDPAHTAWLALGFVNVPGDRTDSGVSVISNFKGSGKDRAVYELTLAQRPVPKFATTSDRAEPVSLPGTAHNPHRPG